MTFKVPSLPFSQLVDGRHELGVRDFDFRQRFLLSVLVVFHVVDHEAETIGTNN